MPNNPVTFNHATSKQDAYPRVVNACTESEAKILTELAEKHIPVSDSIHGFHIEIIWTVRHQCECCYPVLEALVVAPFNHLYKIRVGPEAMCNGQSKVTVIKLETTETVVFSEGLREHPIKAPLHPSPNSRRWPYGRDLGE